MKWLIDMYTIHRIIRVCFLQPGQACSSPIEFRLLKPFVNEIKSGRYKNLMTRFKLHIKMKFFNLLLRCFHDVVINKILRLRTWRLSWGPFLHVLRSTIYSIHIMFSYSCWWFFSSRYLKHHISTQCFKIAKKVAFNIVSEARYVFILSGQKLIKNAKNGRFWRVFENLKLTVQQCSQTDHYEIIPFLF